MLQIETLKKTLEKEKSIETHTRKTETKSGKEINFLKHYPERKTIIKRKKESKETQ